MRLVDFWVNSLVGGCMCTLLEVSCATPIVMIPGQQLAGILRKQEDRMNNRLDITLFPCHNNLNYRG